MYAGTRRGTRASAHLPFGAHDHHRGEARTRRHLQFLSDHFQGLYVNLFLYSERIGLADLQQWTDGQDGAAALG